MTTYTVTFQGQGEVEAESEADAREKAEAERASFYLDNCLVEMAVVFVQESVAA